MTKPDKIVCRAPIQRPQGVLANVQAPASNVTGFAPSLTARHTSPANHLSFRMLVIASHGCDSLQPSALSTDSLQLRVKAMLWATFEV